VKTFDFGFNMGVRSGVKLLQCAVNQCNQNTLLAVDGILGSGTVKAVNTVKPSLLLTALISQAKNHYTNIAQHKPVLVKYLHGWLNRAERLPAWATV
jgi:lysozyme family protein